ncbi:divergent polysaccharide deacetylase family protein [Marinimicrobium sp. C2-29]|uniref:divergent polysaccharide deacetylase family protein n=1 Tax=Marinimicrobium sp. C2-29 TaxID=3139825 RepID=UPI0031395B10
MRPPLRQFLLFLWLGCLPPALWAGQLAIIIDDIGYSATLGERSLQLPGEFTFAILPQAPYGPRLARLANERGREVMLHNPMSNTRNLPLDGGALSGEMTHRDFMATLDYNLEAIPEARGLNNHMGSQLTQETRPMGWLMERLGERGFYFIDSRTTADSRALETAQRYQIPSLQRDVFLDHERDSEQIARQLAEAIELARERGYAIAIGHPYPETLAVLEHIEPALKRAGVELVPVSRLLHDQPGSRPHTSGSCLAPPQSLWHQPEQEPRPTAIRSWIDIGLPDTHSDSDGVRLNQHLLFP